MSPMRLKLIGKQRSIKPRQDRELRQESKGQEDTGGARPGIHRRKKKPEVGGGSREGCQEGRSQEDRRIVPGSIDTRDATDVTAVNESRILAGRQSWSPRAWVVPAHGSHSQRSHRTLTSRRERLPESLPPPLGGSGTVLGPWDAGCGLVGRTSQR